MEAKKAKLVSTVIAVSVVCTFGVFMWTKLSCMKSFQELMGMIF